jgi:hypothetical protein
MLMSDYVAQVRSLIRTAANMPESTASLSVMEEAVRLADTHQDVRLGIAARLPLMHLARTLLRGDVLATAFAWCLAHYDRNPELFAGRNLFWEYRMVIGQLSNLYDVSRAKLEELLADFGRRLQAAGYTLRSLHEAQQAIAPDLGDRELARSALAGMRKYPKDGLSSGDGWDLGEEVELEVFLGNEDRALQLATPFLTDRYSEHSKSDSVCAHLLLPLLKRGRAAEAAKLHRRCLRTYQPQRCYYWPYGELLKFAALTGNSASAARLYEECQRAIKPFTDPLTRLHFEMDAWVVFDRLLAAGTNAVPLRLPDYVPAAALEGQYAIAEMRAWLWQEAGELADRFDRRNGNSYFREQLQERVALGQLVSSGTQPTPSKSEEI